MTHGPHGAVVVGVDGSQDATTGLAWALRHAQVAGLAVCVVHAWLPEDEPDAPPLDSTIPGYLPVPPARQGRRYLRDRALSERAARERVHRAMNAAAVYVPIGRSLVTPVVLRGDPGAVLVELSRDGAQLVVGATGSGALPGILTPALGATARYALRHAWCPVTVVPSARLRAGAEPAAPAASTASTEWDRYALDHSDHSGYSAGLSDYSANYSTDRYSGQSPRSGPRYHDDPEYYPDGGRYGSYGP